MIHPFDQFDISLLYYLVQYLFHVLREFVSMALCTVNSPRPHSVASAATGHWKRLAEMPVAPSKRPKDSSDDAGRNAHHAASEGAAAEAPPPLASGSGHHDVARPSKNLQYEETQGRPMIQKLELESEVGQNCKLQKKLTRRRPARIVIPESCPGPAVGFGYARKENDEIDKVVEVEEKDYSLACRKGKRHGILEDGYGVISNINGDPKQAFFGVFDGHGGRAAVDFVMGNLGKNIIAALHEQEKEDDPPEEAIKSGYLTTDREFLSKGMSSGVCAATVLVKDGELHVANVGDCRVVMSRNGVANALTHDHRAGREDERNRIECSGGYVTSRNELWRVQDTLAVSRAIGDAAMKEWIISEPETKKIPLTADCQFLIMASDGLWDKVTNQEAVDVVLKHSNSIKSCTDLVEISVSRGNRDDITVMVVDLQNFVKTGG